LTVMHHLMEDPNVRRGRMEYQELSSVCACVRVCVCAVEGGGEGVVFFCLIRIAVSSVHRLTLTLRFSSYHLKSPFGALLSE